MDGWLHCLLTNCPEIAIQHMSDWILYQTTLCENIAAGAAAAAAAAAGTRRHGAAASAFNHVDRRRPTGAKSLPVSLLVDDAEDTLGQSGDGGSKDDNIGCGNNSGLFYVVSTLDGEDKDDTQSTNNSHISATTRTAVTGVSGGGEDADSREETTKNAAELLPIGDLLLIDENDQEDTKNGAMTTTAGAAGAAAHSVLPSTADLRIDSPSSHFAAPHGGEAGSMTHSNSSSGIVAQRIPPVGSASNL